MSWCHESLKYWVVDSTAIPQYVLTDADSRDVPLTEMKAQCMLQKGHDKPHRTTVDNKVIEFL